MKYWRSSLCLSSLIAFSALEARADIPPPDACTKAGETCNNAGKNADQPGICATRTCTRGSPSGTMTYDCLRCVEPTDASVTDAGHDSGAVGAGGTTGSAGGTTSGNGGSSTAGGSHSSGGAGGKSSAGGATASTGGNASGDGGSSHRTGGATSGTGGSTGDGNGGDSGGCSYSSKQSSAPISFLAALCAGAAMLGRRRRR